nr:hypothetical protein [Tanacetum cinerariifolium]
MLAMPSPATVCKSHHEIWCRSGILSVSSLNKPKSRVLLGIKCTRHSHCQVRVPTASEDLLTKPFDARRFQYLVCKLFPLLGKLSTVSVFLGFGLTFTGTSKHWGVLRILMISLTLILLDSVVNMCMNFLYGSDSEQRTHEFMHVYLAFGEHNADFHPMVDFIKASPLMTVTKSSLRRYLKLQGEEGIKDKPASPQRDVSQREAFPTDSGFIADQDRATIAKSSTLPHDTAPRVTSPVAVEGSMQQSIPELTALCTSLQRQLSELTDKFQAQEGRRLDKEDVATERVSSDTEDIRLDEGEVAAEKVSDDTEEMATVLVTMDVASVLSSGGVQVVPTTAAVAPANVSISTGSGVVPTASTTISTTTPIFATATTVTPYKGRKGKEKMMETYTPKKKKRLQEQIDIQFSIELEEELEREAQRINAQIARDEEIAKIYAEEELQQMIQGLDRSDETIAKHLEEYDQAAAELIIRERIELIFEGMKFEEVEVKFNSVGKQIEDFIPMGSKDETERIKRKGINLEQESAKKQKISEEVPEEVKSSNEVPKEKIKELIQLVPIEELKHQVKGRIVRNKMHKAFPLQVTEFLLAEQLPTASEEICHY